MFSNWAEFFNFAVKPLWDLATERFGSIEHLLSSNMVAHSSSSKTLTELCIYAALNINCVDFNKSE
jgi:hypothetical protein